MAPRGPERVVGINVGGVMERVACRLFGIVAREAPVVAVFRRGPSKWCQLVRRDTETDRVERGQWFFGRVYERRCDLSPDGRLLVYFGMNGRWDSETRGSWTAISKVPYWTALVLWPKGDCWFGGGLFLDEKRLWLNGAGGPGLRGQRARGLTLVDRHPYGASGNGECLGVYFPRLVREGWRMGEMENVDGVTQRAAWTREVKGLRLIKYTVATCGNRPAGKGCYYDEYAWVADDGAEQAMERVEWADWDRRGRLIFARDGKLWRGAIRNSLLVETLVADLGAGEPEHERSPDAARCW